MGVNLYSNFSLYSPDSESRAYALFDNVDAITLVCYNGMFALFWLPFGLVFLCARISPPACIVLAIATIAFVASLQRSMYRMVGSAMLNQLRVARERLADAGMLGADGQVEVAV